MKRIAPFVLLLSLALQIRAQDPPTPKTPPTLRSILLDQLRTTHNKEDWFVPVNIAVEGLTAEQAKWTPAPGNHSVGQLANHLLFWNTQELAKFKGEQPPKFSGNNDETFNNFDAAEWTTTVQQLDKVLTEWEKAVEAADDKKLEQWAPTIARVGTHNAYHTGQIIYVRKLQGVWDSSKGVK
jgi:uncharacterized damage-inducible protein DinB